MTIQKIEQFFIALFLITLGIASSKGLFSFPVEPFKAIGIVFILLFLFNMNNNIKLVSILPKYFLYFLVYIYLLTFISFLISFQFSSDINTNISQRYLIQLISYTGQIAIGFYLYKYLLKDSTFVKKYLFYGFYIVLFFALVQIIGIYTQTFTWGAVDTMTGRAITRISSISGEPKMFAAYILPFVLYYLYNHFREQKSIGIFSLIVYVKAFSTSSYLVFIFSLMAIYIKKRVSLLKIFIAAILILFIFSNDYIYERSIGRIEMILGVKEMGYNPDRVYVNFPIINKKVIVDGTEASSYELVLHHPWILLTGVGYGMESIYAYLYFNASTASWMGLNYQGVLSPNNALLRNSLYYSFLFIIYFLFHLLKIGRRLLKSTNSVHVFFGILLIVSSISNLLIFSNHFYFIPLVFMSLALKKLYLQEKVKEKS